MNHVQVADTVGVAPETVSRWKRDPLFTQALSDAHDEIFVEVQEKFQSATSYALQALMELVQQDDDLKTKARAAIAINHFAAQHHERLAVQKLQAEIAELKEMLANGT